VQSKGWSEPVVVVVIVFYNNNGQNGGIKKTDFFLFALVGRAQN